MAIPVGCCAMKLRTPLSITALVAAGAFAIAACGGSSSPSGSNNNTGGTTASTPKAALLQAASASTAEAGYKVKYTISASTAEGNFSGTGTGTFNRAPQNGAVQLNLTGLPEIGSAQMSMITSGSTIYIDAASLLSHLPSADAGLASGYLHGKTWLEIDLASLGKSAAGGLGSLASTYSGFSKPGSYLKYLAAASNIKNVGSATINGVATTEYTADVDVSKVAGLGAVAKDLPSSEPVSIWIDGNNLVRQITVDASGSTGSAAAAVSSDTTLDFLSYGPQATPAIPSASETLNLSSLLSGHLGL
jgi:hypothetical protein